MYLDTILGSKTKVNILATLIQSPNEEIIESNLAKKAGSSTSEVNRQINDLTTIGLIKLKKIGRTKLYTINQDHFLYPPLNHLYRSLTEIYQEIAQKITKELTKNPEIKTIILTGSLQTGTIREDYVKNPSDIDIIIIVDKKTSINKIQNTALNYNIDHIFPKYGINTYTIVLTTNEYIKGLKTDKFIMNIHTHGELLYGQKPSRFNQMGTTKINRIP